LSLFKQAAARFRALLSADTDQALVRARSSGEMLVAGMRLAFVGVFGSLVLFNLSPGTRALEIGLVLGAMTYASLLLLGAAKIRQAWISWVSTAVDVSLVSASLLLFALAGYPHEALNNRLFFEIYFFVMVNATLRYDWRLCAFATGLVLLQFLGLTAFVTTHWNLASMKQPVGGFFDAFQHTLRVVLLGAVGASTVAVARWARHLRLMVGTDHLTGLSQRRPFLERVEEELQRSTGRSTLSVALLDVDEFKKFNDSHGHLAGDRALQILAARLRKSVRGSDLVARFGGEEFVIAFPRLDVERAVRRVNELRAELARVPIPVAGEALHLTVSAGVGCWPTDGQSFDEVLAKVDERLYEAKRQGRNQVIGPRGHLRVAEIQPVESGS
jgi:diguanylate cyclase (GGDEF)-like protein